MTHGTAVGLGVRAFRRGGAQILPLLESLEPLLARPRSSFRAVSWLGDGWIWYAVILALPIAYGVDGLQAALQLTATGALSVLLYKIIKNHAVRERPVHHALGDRVRLGAARPLQFPVRAHAACGLLHGDVDDVLARVDWRIRRARIADRLVARDPRAPLPHRRGRRRRARRGAWLRQRAARAAMVRLAHRPPSS